MRQANKGKLLLLPSSVSLTQLLGEEGGEWRRRDVRLSLGIGDSHKRVAVTGNSSTYVEDVELAVDPYHLEWNLITLLSRCTSCRCITRFILQAIESAGLAEAFVVGRNARRLCHPLYHTTHIRAVDAC